MFYISQIDESDCGYATLRIALANLYHNKNALFLNFNQGKKMASYYDLVNCAKEYGLTLVPFKTEELFNCDSSHLPILVEIKIEGNNHLVYMYKTNQKYVYYLDPARGKIKQKIGEFNSIWNKRGLFVSNYNLKFVIQKTQFFKINETVSLLLFQIASSLCCILGFYFLDTKYPIYLPIIMCVLFAIMEVSLRKYALILTKRIDNRFDLIEGEINKNDYYEYFTIRQNLKKTFVINIMSFCGACCIICLCGFLLCFNTPVNLIYMGVSMLLGFISALFINRKLIKKNSIILHNEKNINKNESFANLKHNINIINELGFNYANSYLAWRFIVVSVSVITSILFMFILNINNPAYIILMTMITYMMYQQFDVLFSYQARKNEKNSLLVKFMNMFQKHS